MEGFGIVYYCAFHACRANNNGDLSKCYPEFKSDDDWKPSGISYSDLKKLSDDVNDCITDGYLDSDDITSNGDVATYNTLLSKRSYLCLAEGEVVKFLTGIYTNWAGEDDAISLVYGRHLADEKCFGGTGDKLCPSNTEVYGVLTSALKSLVDKCEAAKKPNSQHPRYGGYGRPQYGDPQYGTEAKYGRQPTYDNYYSNDKYASDDYGNNYGDDDDSYGEVYDSGNYDDDRAADYSYNAKRYGNK